MPNLYGLLHLLLCNLVPNCANRHKVIKLGWLRIFAGAAIGQLVIVSSINIPTSPNKIIFRYLVYFLHGIHCCYALRHLCLTPWCDGCDVNTQYKACFCRSIKTAQQAARGRRGGERGEEDIYSLKEAPVADMKPKMIVLFEKVKSSLNLNWWWYRPSGMMSNSNHVGRAVRRCGRNLCR